MPSFSYPVLAAFVHMNHELNRGAQLWRHSHSGLCMRLKWAVRRKRKPTKRDVAEMYVRPSQQDHASHVRQVWETLTFILPHITSVCTSSAFQLGHSISKRPALHGRCVKLHEITLPICY